jgi:hypothetical protein
MIKARVVLRLIGGNRHYCARMARSYPPQVQVDKLVAAVFNGETHVLRHALVGAHVERSSTRVAHQPARPVCNHQVGRRHQPAGVIQSQPIDVVRARSELVDAAGRPAGTAFPWVALCSIRRLICKLRIAAVDLPSEAAKKTRHHCRAKVNGHCLRLSAQTSIAPIAQPRPRRTNAYVRHPPASRPRGHCAVTPLCQQKKADEPRPDLPRNRSFSDRRRTRLVLCPTGRPRPHEAKM